MSLSKTLLDDLERDLSGEERPYSEDVYDLSPWPDPPSWAISWSCEHGEHSTCGESLAQCACRCHEDA